MKQWLICRVENMKYGTRRLKAGDRFEATSQHARLLTRTHKAEYADGPRDKADIPPMPETLRNRVMAGRPPAAHPPASAPPSAPALPVTVHDHAPEPEDDRAALREEYETKLGKRPYMGWDADTLRAKIAQVSE